jgi:cytochrome c
METERLQTRSDLFFFAVVLFTVANDESLKELPDFPATESMKLHFPVFALTLLGAAAIRAESPSNPLADEHFKVETIASGLVDAMELAVTSDGRIFVVERTGAVKLFQPDSGKTTTIATLDVEVRNDTYAREAGLLGVTLDPGFDTNRWLYLFYSLKEESTQRLARFTFRDGGLLEETVILEFPHDRENAVCHEAGSLAFGPDGCLYLSTGDNTCPFESDGYAPIDERPDRHWYDAQRSAANTNDLRGKILRIRPLPEGGYEIPDGNLFPKGRDKTRPEIFAMGCRNPYRISIDSRTGFVYWGEVGPDAAADSERGSVGFDEINQAREAGNFGWHYAVADTPYSDFDFSSDKPGSAFAPAGLVNRSPNSTGETSLPAAVAPLWHYPRASACAGPVYHFDDYPDNDTKLPRELDRTLIIYDWTSAWLRRLHLDEESNVIANEPFLSRHLFIHPGDMAMGPAGELYVLEYGSAWYDGTDGAIKKITWSKDPIPLPSGAIRSIPVPSSSPAAPASPAT